MPYGFSWEICKMIFLLKMKRRKWCWWYFARKTKLNATRQTITFSFNIITPLNQYPYRVVAFDIRLTADFCTWIHSWHIINHAAACLRIINLIKFIFGKSYSETKFKKPVRWFCYSIPFHSSLPQFVFHMNLKQIILNGINQ